MDATLATDLALVRGARIAFYHHSVGGNVLDGVAALDARLPGARVHMAGWEGAAASSGPVLAHGEGGHNGNPATKIDAFASVIRSGRVAPDVAFMKFCYVDFTPSTDVEALFERYRGTMESLKREHPEIRFAHVTVPLTERPDDLRSRVSRVIGRLVWEDSANARRNEFNERLKAVFAADPILDLALVEASGPQGAQSTFTMGDRSYLALHPSYSADGGHLNPAGQRRAGAAAIGFLADAIRSRTASR